MVESSWSNQEKLLSVTDDVVYHFRRLSSWEDTTTTNVRLSVLESTKGKWATTAGGVEYADLPESVKDELNRLNVVVIE